MRINPKWIESRQREIDDFKDVTISGPKVIDVVSNYNPASQWLILNLAKNNISFKVINLGAGVKRITTQTDVCPKCNGTGRC